MIEGPAARYAQNVAKLDLDPRLTQALLDELDRGGGRDVLPLLAFTLQRLWGQSPPRRSRRIFRLREGADREAAIPYAVEEVGQFQGPLA